MPVEKRVVEQQLEALGDFQRLFTAKEIRFLPQVLIDGETIYGLTSGFYEGKSWIVVVTDMRIVFLDKGMFYGLKQIDMPLSHISSVSHKTGFFLGEITVATAGGARTIAKIKKREVLKISTLISTLAYKLDRLAALREKGALTEEEFQISKQRVMRDLV